MKKWMLFFCLITFAMQAQQKRGVNPADAIIRKVIDSRISNDPKKKLSSFSFKSYTKLIVSANPDSIRGKLDTIKKKKLFGKRYIKIDSTQYKFKKFIRRQHFFETEKVSNFQFNGDDFKETIVGTKMSGFREPIYEILGFNMQSFSVYDENYELFEIKYNSPIASDAFSDYLYQLLDSTEIEGRKVYRISFKNKKKRKKAGLEGVLSIDSDSYAMAKAAIKINGFLKINSRTDFVYLPAEDLWFPISRSLKVTKGYNDEDIRLPGNTIAFDALTRSKRKREKQTSDYTYLRAETNYSNFTFNEPVKIRKPFIAIEVKDAAINQDDGFWNKFRNDSIDSREYNTYMALDSIVERGKIEKRLRLGRKIINGYVPFGPIDLDLRYLLSYNNYEGFRIGIGGITNDKFSNKYRLEGYSAYGTKDGGFKYSLGGAARIGRFSNTWIGGSYTEDVKEIASTSFVIDPRVFKLYDPRPINVSTFYAYNMTRAFIETKIIPKTESIWQVSQSRVEPKFDYVFLANGQSYSVFHMTTAQTSIQWNPFSDFMQTPTGRIEVEKRFPKFTFQFTKSLPKILDNDFSFGKIDFRSEYEKKYLNGQKSALVLEAGYAYGDIPLTHLYNTSPNSLTKDKILERVTIAGKNSFETMYFNEFFSREYVMLQLKHGFKRTTLFSKVSPALVLVTRMAWGNMQHPEQHLGIDYKTLDKGYFESGVELNQIYSGFGLSGFYRYGPNQLARFEDNLSIKASFILNIGL